MRARTVGWASALALALLLAGALALLAPRAAAAPQFTTGPDGWQYRMSVGVTNNGAAAWTSMPVVVTFNSLALINAGKMRSDCADVRVTDFSGVAVPYFIESGCGTTTTYLWIKTGSIGASTSATYYLYYGSALASSAASVSSTFAQNQLRTEVADCSGFEFCTIANAGDADTWRSLADTLCGPFFDSAINMGDPCTLGSPGTNVRDGFVVTYHFYFVPDTTGTWTFGMTSDDSGQVETTVTDDQAVTSHSVILHNYLGDPSPVTSVTRSMTAGVGVWLNYVSVDQSGPEQETFRVTRPGGSSQVLSSANFPGLFFRRDLPSATPTITLLAEQALPSQPTSVVATAGPNPGAITVAWSAPSSWGTGSSQWYTLYGRDAGTTPWSRVGSICSACTLQLTDTGLGNGRAREYSLTANSTLGEGARSAGSASATTWSLPGTPVLTATAQSNHTITIAFADTGNGGTAITSHVIYRLVSGAPQFFANAGGAGTTSYAATGLLNGQGYSFEVSAVNAVGESGLSGAGGGVPGAQPNPPGNVTATRGNHTIHMAWDPAYDQGYGLAYYRIWNGTQIQVANAGLGTSFDINSLANNFTYTFNMTANNTAGNSSTSNTVTATPLSVTDPPDKFSVLAGNQTATLTWQAPANLYASGLGGYHVWNGTTLLKTVIGATSATFSLANNFTYTLNVTTFNAAGESASTPAITFTPQTIADPPGSLTATPGNFSVALSWTRPNDWASGIGAYRVWNGTTLVATLPPGSTSTTIATSNNFTYAFNVTALNVRGDSVSSNVATADPLSVTDPPQLSAATAGNASVALAWVAPPHTYQSGLGGYFLWRGTTLLTSLSASNTTFTDLTVANGATYSYNLTTFNIAGNSSTSNALTAAPMTIPYPPHVPTLQALNRSINVAWADGQNGGSPITGYRITATCATQGCAQFNGPAGGSPFLVTGLTNGSSYDVRVYAQNAVGESNPGALVSATPIAPADPPILLSLTPGNGTVTFHFQAAASDGGSPINGYTIWRGLTPGSEQGILGIGGDAQTTSFSWAFPNGELAYYKMDTCTTSAPCSVTGNELSAKPAGVPYPPTSVSVAAGNRTLSVSWSDAYDGGDSIVDHRVTATCAAPCVAFDQTGVTSPFTINGLTNGSLYTVSVYAINGAGASHASTAITATPLSRPDPPGSLIATRGDRSVALAWTSGDNGGAPLSGYTIWMGASPGAEAPIATTTNGNNVSFVVNGLSNGQTYSFNATATNSVAMSGSSAHVSATPATRPDVPIDLAATPGNHTVLLSWSAPFDEGSPILRYQVWNGTQLVASPASTSYPFSAPANGYTYSFNVTAVNALGASGSTPIVTATPASIPDPPTNLVATRGNHSLTLTWSAGYDQGSSIQSYHVWNGSTLVGTALGPSFPWSGLANGYAYTLNVTAVNGIGESATSGLASATPASIPDPPVLVSAVRGDRSVALHWSAGYDEGSGVTSYRVWRALSGGTRTLVATVDGATFDDLDAGLANGQVYDYNVTAINAVGTSATSNVLSARPATLPSAPRSLVGDFADQGAALHWAGPVSDGGESVIDYQPYVGSSASDLSAWGAPLTGTSGVVHGLTNGVPYAIGLRARNAVGLGPLSSLVTVTPMRVPDAPTISEVTAGEEQVRLVWTPNYDGGAPITGYDLVNVTPGGLVRIDSIGTNTSYMIRGLHDGYHYQFEVRASNAAGGGAFTSPIDATPLGPPGAPTITFVTTGTTGSSITLTWSPPASDGGVPIVYYRVNASQGADQWIVGTFAATGGSQSITDTMPSGATRSYNVTAFNRWLGPASANAIATRLPSPLDPLPDTYRTCEAGNGAAACTVGSRQLVTAIAAGARHTCALLADARVDCYGDDAAGQAADHLSGRSVVAISAGWTHTCALLDTRNVDCWGTSANGKASSVLDGNVSALAAGGSHTCFLHVDQSVSCQGSNAYGQSAGRAGSSGIRALAAGGYDTCFLLANRSVECQGLDEQHERDGDWSMNASAISAGGFHACALHLDASVRCWGDIVQPPVSVQQHAIAIASGRSHACAILATGSVSCWGSDRDGQAAGYAGSDAIALALGDSHSCVLLRTGNVTCWGAGATDNGESIAYPTPTGTQPNAPATAAAIQLAPPTIAAPTVDEEI